MQESNKNPGVEKKSHLFGLYISKIRAGQGSTSECDQIAKEIFQLWLASEFQKIKNSKEWDASKIEDLIAFRKACMSSLQTYVLCAGLFTDYANITMLNNDGESLLKSLKTNFIDSDDNKDYKMNLVPIEKLESKFNDLFGKMTKIDNLKKAEESIKTLWLYNDITAEKAKENFPDIAEAGITTLKQKLLAKFIGSANICIDYLASIVETGNEGDKIKASELFDKLCIACPQLIKINEERLAKKGLNVFHRMSIGDKDLHEMEYKNNQTVDSVVNSLFIAILLHQHKFPERKLGIVFKVSDQESKTSKQSQILDALDKKIKQNNIKNVECIKVKVPDSCKGIHLNEESIQLLNEFQKANGENGTLVFSISESDKYSFKIDSVKEALSLEEKSAATKKRPMEKEKEKILSYAKSISQSAMGIFSFRGSKNSETSLSAVNKETSFREEEELKEDDFVELSADRKSSANSKSGCPVLDAFGSKDEVLLILGCKDIKLKQSGASCLVFSDMDAAEQFRLKIQPLLDVHGKIWSCTVENEEKVTVIFSSAQMWLITSYLLLKQTVDGITLASKAKRERFMNTINSHFMSLESAYNDTKVEELSSKMIETCAYTDKENNKSGKLLRNQYEEVFSKIKTSLGSIPEENRCFVPKGSQQNQKQNNYGL